LQNERTIQFFLLFERALSSLSQATERMLAQQSRTLVALSIVLIAQGFKPSSIPASSRTVVINLDHSLQSKIEALVLQSCSSGTNAILQYLP